MSPEHPGVLVAGWCPGYGSEGSPWGGLTEGQPATQGQKGRRRLICLTSLTGSSVNHHPSSLPSVTGLCVHLCVCMREWLHL
jgi:hypothetical protein